MKVVIYCPDEHMQYDGDSPDKTGIGGGITVRIRMASALARLGHQVTMYVNVSTPGTYDGVNYQHFSQAKEIHCDVFMAQSSGGKLDLAALRETKIEARLRVALFPGFAHVSSWRESKPSIVYTNSNFTRRTLISQWDIPPENTFVVYHGLDQKHFRSIEATQEEVSRDPFGLLYVGHPAKGLERAKQILRKLRLADTRYHLDVYGGYALWGDTEKKVEPEPGIYEFGLLSSDDLIRALYRYKYGLFIQRYEEPFGISPQEARRAGVIDICTPVGAFPELFHHGYDAFIIDEPYESEKVVDKTVDLIRLLNQHPDYTKSLSHNARAVQWNWDMVAATLIAHWEWVLNGHSSNVIVSGMFCPECFEHLYAMPDGEHCFKCGFYMPKLRAGYSVAGSVFHTYAKWVHEYNRYKIRIHNHCVAISGTPQEAEKMYKRLAAGLFEDYYNKPQAVPLQEKIASGNSGLNILRKKIKKLFK